MSRVTYGANQERKLANSFRSEGYEVVRSTRSLGTFDLIALKTKKDIFKGKGTVLEIRLIQVKTGTWPSSKEMEAIRRYARATRTNSNIRVQVIRFNRGSNKVRIVDITGFEPEGDFNWKNKWEVVNVKV